MKTTDISVAVKALQSGEVIAYPTEAVFGLGCDPFDEQAVRNLFHVKQRPMEKGVILISSSVEQVLSYVQLTDMPWEQQVLDSWPGPVTWVLPLKNKIPDWITGGRESVAIRVSDHPIVQSLCAEFGKPIVSTSANITNQPPAKSCEEIFDVFGESLVCVQGELGHLQQPTQIKDALTGQVLR